MKVLLVKVYSGSHVIGPPLGLGYLATAVRGSHDVRLIDCERDGIKLSGFISYLREYRPDVAGFQVYSFDAGNVKRWVSTLKKLFPGIVTVIGGPHPSCLPAESLDEFPGADYAFCGEAESGFPVFLDLLSGKGVKKEDVPGLIYRRDGTTHVNRGAVPENLDDAGMPSWDLIRPQDYPRGAVQGAFVKNYPVASMITSRGCPYSCIYCAGPLIFGHRVRLRSVDDLVKEVKLLHYDYGIKEIQIVDDHFTFDIRRAKEFCRRIIAEKIKISFYGVSGIRIDRIDGELLDLMKRAGFYHIAVGIESGSDRILKLIKKKLDTDTIRRQVKFIRSKGLDVIGFFMLGFPGETKADMMKTIRLALELDLKRATFSCVQPLPGTELYRHLAACGRRGDIDFGRMHFSHASFSTGTVTANELSYLQKYAFMRFMFRPRIIWRHIMEIHSPGQLGFLLKRFMDYILKK